MRTPRAVVRLVARLKPAVPDSLWPLLLTARSFAGRGPLVGVPPFGRVLVLAPHPDDDSVGCAGTLALLARAGASTTVAYASDGQATRGADLPPDDIVRLRRSEAARACALVGAHPEFFGYVDGRLATDIAAIANDIMSMVERVEPDAIFAPWFLDDHDDHRAVAHALTQLTLPADLEIWSYEVWTPLATPNRLVDISAVLELKEATLAEHVTANQAFELSAMVGLNRYRSVHGLMGRGHAEAFLAMPFDTYRSLATSQST